MARITIRHEPPSHGWLSLQLSIDGQDVEIDASDVPNNPIQELIDTLDRVVNGIESTVWWNLEPDGYFMTFTPLGEDIALRLEYAQLSDRNRSRVVVAVRGQRAEILLPFWRFLREFQSHDYVTPHWPSVSYERMFTTKAAITGTGA
jgi:hypothetical protein